MRAGAITRQCWSKRRGGPAESDQSARLNRTELVPVSRAHRLVAGLAGELLARRSLDRPSQYPQLMLQALLRAGYVVQNNSVIQFLREQRFPQVAIFTT